MDESIESISPVKSIDIVGGYELLLDQPNQVFVHRVYPKERNQTETQALSAIFKRGTLTSGQLIESSKLKDVDEAKLQTEAELGIRAFGLNCSVIGENESKDKVFDLADGYFFYFSPQNNKARVCVHQTDYPMLVTEVDESRRLIGGFQLPIKEVQLAITANDLTPEILETIFETQGREWFTTHVMVLPSYNTEASKELFRKLLKGKSSEAISEISIHAALADDQYLTSTLLEKEHFDSFIAALRREGSETVIGLSLDFAKLVELRKRNLLTEDQANLMDNIEQNWERVVAELENGCDEIVDSVKYSATKGYMVIETEGKYKRGKRIVPVDVGTKIIVEEQKTFGRVMGHTLHFTQDGKQSDYELRDF